MKKILALLLALWIPAAVLSGCAPQDDSAASNKLNIVTTIFPAYDWVREILGDETDRAEITTLLDSGVDLHSYQPTVDDIVKISDCDLFLYVGGESDGWVDDALKNAPNKDRKVIRLLDVLGDSAKAEETVEGMQEEEHDHEEEELDEHVWTTPGNAAKICYALCDKLCELDPDNANEYMLNYEVYNAKLMELDIDIRTTVMNGARKTLVFADRFPMRYFTREYGLTYYAAYPGCASQTEPSAKTVAFLIDHVREENIPAVLYMEFSNEKMADVICEDTGCKKLPFYSAHSITAQQFEDGVTYLDLMRMNIETLKEALY